ncbi:hypothetical protein JR316_0005611 [Psilocybe cubensis]|uniref:NB-ARC domain-containing protein n=2 Tax=Psilocybe cubensis TaxID=181762 RepID=A0A8H7XY32_PSICU|nr:hypothetical protein JR316_0005611 [Psilocybe cubensis]KAH9481092.1 hypothetical protein JR316_0005611 [Psilocybe cubensis]
MAHMWNEAKNVVVQGGTFVAQTVEHSPYISSAFSINVFPRIFRAQAEALEDTTASSAKKDFSRLGPIFPEPLVDVYGRDEYLEDLVLNKILAQFVSKSENKRHVAIKGGHGIGKTTVANKVIRDPRIVKYFGNARHWVSCREASFIDNCFKGQKLLEYISRSLGLELTASNNLLYDVRYFLETNNVPRIIIFDNFETMWGAIEAGEGVGSILKALAQHTQVLMVITTRFIYPPAVHLGVSWHSLDTLSPLSLDASRDLFMSICPQESIDKYLDELLLAVNCLPLAIVLMASTAHGSFTTYRILERWRKGLQCVAPDRKMIPGDPVKHLGPSIEMSLEGPLLKHHPDAVVLLRIIAGLPGGIKVANLQQIVPGIPRVDEVQEILQQTYLIYEEDGLTRDPEDRVLQMHSTIRKHMLENYHLDSEHERNIQNFYFRLIHEAGKDPGAKDFLACARRLSKEEINAKSILTGVLRDEANEYQDFVAAITVAMDYCNYLIWNTPSTDIAEKTVDLLKKRLPSGTSVLLSPMENLNAHRNRVAGQCSRNIGSEQLFAMEQYPLALLHLGKLQSRLSRYGESKKTFNQLLQHCNPVEHRSRTAEAEFELAQIYRIQGDHEKALELFYNVYSRSGDEARRRAAAQRGIAIVHFDANNIAEALEALNKSKRIFPESDQACQADYKLGVGRIHRNHDQTLSISLLSEARDYYTEHGPRREAAITLYQKSIAQYLKGEFDDAERGLNDAFDEFRPLRNDAQMGYCVYHLALLNMKRRRLRDALSLFRRAEKMFAHMDNKLMVGLSLKGQGDVLTSLFRIQEAANAYDKADTLLGSVRSTEATTALKNIQHTRYAMQWYITLGVAFAVLFTLALLYTTQTTSVDIYGYIHRF